jgi:acylphosphatase
MPATVRKRFTVKGRVQRVGYRALVLAFADGLGIKGVVRNLADKSVEIVCEGRPKAIASFLKAIDRKGDPMDPLSINVATIEEAPPPPEGELTGFIIDYGRELDPIERESLDRDEIMILGAGILNFKVDGVGNDIKAVGQKIDSVGNDVQQVGLKVDSMHSDMNTRFDHMAQRYDLIAASLVKAIDRMDQGFERMDKDSKRTDRAMERSRKEAAASNRELAKAVRFMITKLSKKASAPRKARQKKRRNRR